MVRQEAPATFQTHHLGSKAWREGYGRRLSVVNTRDKVGFELRWRGLPSVTVAVAMALVAHNVIMADGGERKQGMYPLPRGPIVVPLSAAATQAA